MRPPRPRESEQQEEAAFEPSYVGTLPRAMARPQATAWGRNEAEAAAEARKARGAAFGPSYVRMLPRAMARSLAKAWGLKEAKSAWEAKSLRGQHSDRAMLECCPELWLALSPRPGG